MRWYRQRQRRVRVTAVGSALGLALAAWACGAEAGSSAAAAASPGSSSAAAASPGSPSAAAASADPSTSQRVLPGVELLFRDSLHLVSNRRVGLITNPTGTDAQGRSTIDRLYEHPDVALTTLFAPEHGLRATEGEGQRIEDSRDPATGLPVVSLYAGSKRAPSAADLDAIDVLVFDMQDVGARYYTYVYTMSLAMEAAGDAGIPFVVLDRPNPIGLAVQGNVLDPAFATFVGLHPVPMRHGMTAGELARLFRGAFGVEVDLSVVPVEGWDPGAGYEATGLEWIPPSPNMPSVASALHYPGTCLFEGTNLSVGRGTDRPFQQVGAPWLDADSLAARLTRRNLPGVEVLPVRFVPRDPSDGKWADRELEGVRLRAVDPGAYDPTLTSLAVLVEARAMAGDAWEWNVAHFDRLAGTDRLRAGVDAGEGVDALHRSWAADREAFESLADPYRLYPR